MVLNQVRKFYKLAKHFTEQKDYFYQYLYLKTMKKGHQGIISLDTFFTFKDFIIPVILEVPGINLENRSDQVKLLFF